MVRLVHMVVVRSAMLKRRVESRTVPAKFQMLAFAPFYDNMNSAYMSGALAVPDPYQHSSILLEAQELIPVWVMPKTRGRYISSLCHPQ